MFASVSKLIDRFFAPKNLIKPELVRGEIPSAKEAYPIFIKIAIPSVIELVLVSLISMADTAMVGVLGPHAISSVGITSQPVMLLLFIFIALNIGVTAVVARRKGEGRQADANTVLRMALMLAFFLSIAVTVLGLVFARPLMQFAGAKPEIIDNATSYFKIVTSVLPLRALALTITAAHKGTGYTKISMQINIVANLVNVTLNFLLITGRFGLPALGIEGAAIATAVGNSVAFLLAILSIFNKNHYLHIARRQSWKPDKEAFSAIFKVGGSALLEQMVLRFGFFMYSRILAGLSIEEFATHNICMQALNLSYTFADGLGVGATSLVGQNMGMNRHDLSVMYGKIAQRIAFLGSLVFGALFIVARRPIVGLFLNPEQDINQIMELGSTIMIMAGCFMPLQTSQIVMAGSLRGAGDTKYVAGTMLLTIGLMRPALSYIAVYVLNLGLPGAWASMFLDMSVRLVVLFFRFSRGKWFKIKV